MQSLGLLPGYPAGGYTGIFGPSTAATGINDSGQIVGSAFFVTGGILTYPPPPAPHAFLYSGAVMQDLGTFPGGSQSEATGINDSGQVVGYADNSSGSEHAFLVSGGTMRDLGTLPGGSNSYATAINNSGQVVGYGDGSDGNQHAFLYSGGAMQELTFPGAWETLALGINNRGQVVGEAHIAGANMGAFLYSNGAMVDLNSVTAARGWILEQATGINDSGEIVGYGVNPSGQTDAFLLTPTPEPSTLCLSITCGFALLASHLRCRRTPTLSANGGPRWRFGLVSQRETD
jgi:probable HAF family extracellular repeat protein